MSRLRHWVKVAFICVFLVCTPLLHAYASFRAVRGETFFRASIIEPQPLYAQTLNTWGMDTGETVSLRVYGASSDTGVRIIFWWGLFADAVPDVPGRPERLVTTVTRGKTTLRFYISAYPEQSEEEINREHPGIVNSIVRRFTDQSAMSWEESIAVQRRWLPSLVRHFVGFYFLPSPLYMLQLLVQSVLMLPGFVPLALLVVSPSWLALPVFWLLWIVPSLLYILSPSRVRAWARAAVASITASLRRRIGS
ncbi:MAG: hypothetical protein ACYDHF_00515 [Candidatus Cryosericum sp.]